jgi:hypothetical protein
VDELHLAVSPVLLGDGERLFSGLGGLPGYEVVEVVSSPRAAHFHLLKK